MYCGKCKQEYKDNIKFCPRCGSEMTKRSERSAVHKSGRWAVLILIVLCFIIGGLYLNIYVFTPSEGTRQKRLSQSKDSVITKVRVDYVLKGIGGRVEIADISNKAEEINHTAGIKGAPVEFSAKRRKIRSAHIQFSYNSQNIGSEDAKRLSIAYCNEKLGRVELLEDSEVDTDKHTVSVKTTHFSRYVVVDSKEWYEAWAESQLIIRDENLAHNYFDIVFALDCSGSMEGKDKNGLSKECTYDFIEKLYDGDYFTVLDFNDSVECVSEKKRVEEVISWNKISSDIQGIHASGGTNIEEALKTSLEYASQAGDDAMPFVVLLSDGQASVSEEALEYASDSGIKIVTVGFGKDADEELLRKIADNTGGQYYKAGSEDITLIFERIREEYVGVDISNDADNDGIPDKIEEIGMRNQYGNVIRTNSEDSDTDNDGIGDGVEMGEVVIDDNVSNTARKYGVSKYVYFEMATDPTVYDENKKYNPKALISLTAEVSDKGDTIESHIEISNGAQIVTTDKDARNVINDIKNTKVNFKIPKCLETKDLKIDIGNIQSGDIQERDVAYVHDNSKCSGEKHVIVAEVSGKNIKTIAKEVRLNGLYWYEKLSEDDYGRPEIALIEKVRGYSSTYDENRMKDVLSSKTLTQKEIAEFWEREKNDKKLSDRLNYLCNDDIYVAHAFRLYLENQNFFQKGTINLSKLVFNDGVVNTVIGHPEQDRYKQVLLDYIKRTMNEMKRECQVGELLDGYSHIIASYQGLASDLEKQQIISQSECRTALDTINSNLEYLNSNNMDPEGISERIKTLVEQGEVLKKNGVHVNVVDQIDSDVLANLEMEKNRLSGISKAASTAGLVITITSDAIQMFDQITEITSVANAYGEYEHLLGLISSETKYPELKAAAEELQQELRDKYRLYADECWDFMLKTGVNSLQTLSGVGLSSFCGAASDIVSTTGLAVVIGKMAINGTLGIDDLLENSVYVIGASEISDILSIKMVKCRNDFNANYLKSYEAAYESAEQFRYYYNHLRRMRIYGEERYLEMERMDGAWEMFGSMIREWNKYEEAQGICGDTVEAVKKLGF